MRMSVKQCCFSQAALRLKQLSKEIIEALLIYKSHFMHAYVDGLNMYGGHGQLLYIINQPLVIIVMVAIKWNVLGMW